LASSDWTLSGFAPFRREPVNWERTTLPLSTDRERVYAAGGRMVLPPHETLLRAFDKQQTTSLAESLGLSVPLTAAVSSEADLRERVHDLRFPVIVKPRSSEECVQGGQARTTGAPLYARDEKELLRAWNTISKRCRSALVQEFTDGSGVGYFALMREVNRAPSSRIVGCATSDRLDREALCVSA
jgi:predicted ATP-grasp superfamily ATP-dependent carboligase